MDLSVLIALCGLAATATPQDVTAHITALMSRPLIPAALAAQLGVPGAADEAAALAALNKKLGTPNAETMTVIAALQAQVATLSAQAADREAVEIVDAALQANKLSPALRDWAVKLGRTDMAQLKSFLADAPPIPGLAGQLHGRKDPGAAGGAGTELTPQQAVLAAQLGLDPKAYLAQINQPAQA